MYQPSAASPGHNIIIIIIIIGIPSSKEPQGHRAFADLMENDLMGLLWFRGRAANLSSGTSRLSVHWQTLMLPQPPEKL